MKNLFDSDLNTLYPLPLLMGIVNCTPDSFFDGGRHVDASAAVAHALKLYEQGARILDIGGESTRPGACDVSPQQELERILPVIKALVRYREKRKADFYLSIDTTKAEVARQALAAGADWINDISMMHFDPEMISLVCEQQATVVLNHIRGVPRTMQQAPSYTDVIQEVAQELWDQAQKLLQGGLLPHQIILDPGIGFGKRREDNYTLISRAKELMQVVTDLSGGLRFPWLYGMSRKSYIGQTQGLETSNRLIPSIISALRVSQQGVHILRVHDVSATQEALLMEKVLQSKS